jgi:hypothetical protein
MATETYRNDLTTEPDGVMSKAALQLRQFLCSLHGHDTLMHFEHGRLSLLCASCGYETPGWDMKKSPNERDTAEPKPRGISMPLVRERRVA